MKRLIILLSILAFGFTAISVSESLRKLSISREQAEQLVTSSIEYGNLMLPGNAGKIADAARAEIVHDMIHVAKEYSVSDTFRTIYSEFRNSRKPIPPEVPKTGEQIQQEMKAQHDKQIADLVDHLKDVPADQQEVNKNMIEQLRNMQLPTMTPEQMVEYDKSMTQMYENEKVEYAQKMADWEKEYPAEPKFYVKTRLTEYLDLSKSVDFSAELRVDTKGLKTFVRDDYEKKPSAWKQCFRAGKAANDAARKDAESWIGEIK